MPKASGTWPSATAAAEPEDEPPGVWAALCGLVVGPGWRLANSVVTVLPRMTALAVRQSATQAASPNGTLPLKIGELWPVGMSWVSMMSFTPTGTPRSTPPFAASAALACASARSGSR